MRPSRGRRPQGPVAPPGSPAHRRRSRVPVLRARRAPSPATLDRRGARGVRRRPRSSTRGAPTRMSRVAVLAPHPDDEVLGCTSVLLEHEVVVVHVTEGVPASIIGDEADRTRLRPRPRESRRVRGARRTSGAIRHARRTSTRKCGVTPPRIANALVKLLPSLEVRRGVRAGVPERSSRPRRLVRRRAARPRARLQTGGPVELLRAVRAR